MTNEANPITGDPISLDLSSATQQQLRAIQNVADRRGITFDEAALQLLLDVANKAEKEAEKESPKSALGRLLRFRIGA